MKNTVTVSEKGTLLVNGKDWGNLGLDTWVLSNIADKSAENNGLRFVLADGIPPDAACFDWLTSQLLYGLDKGVGTALFRDSMFEVNRTFADMAGVLDAYCIDRATCRVTELPPDRDCLLFLYDADEVYPWTIVVPN